jgi:selenocysteine lyase/cysteine desulfurase
MDLSRRTFLATQGALTSALFLPGGLLSAVEAATAPSPKLVDWARIRAQFRLNRDYLHLSGFFIASHPEPVRAAIEGFRRAIDENPFLAVEQGMFEGEAQNLQRRVCEDIALYLGGKPEEIALTGNTTMGLALVYHGLSLKPGDEILTTVHDHVVHHEAIRLSTARNGASVRKIALFEEAAAATVGSILERIGSAIRPATRVLGITWVHSATGIRLPIRRIADLVQEVNRGRAEADHLLLVVDGVHGLGAVHEPIARMGCDFFAAGTHKWMFAPRGTGILWAKAENWARLTPTIPTFSDRECFNAWAQNRPVQGPTVAARVCPGGFHAYEHQWAMGAAFRMHLQIGPKRVADRIFELNDRCRQGLAAIPKLKLHTPMERELSAGINCFEVEGHQPGALVWALLQQRIIASTSPYAVTYARLSAGLMNTPGEVDRAVAAVKRLAT